jgi:hypothetical protein
MVLARMAKEVGLNKFVVTHANSTIWKMAHDQIRKVVDLGGYIEFCYLTNLWGPGTGLPDFVRMSDAEFVAYVTVAPERSFITTDLGQIGMPNPLNGMRMCISCHAKGRGAEKGRERHGPHNSRDAHGRHTLMRENGQSKGHSFLQQGESR